MCLAVRNPLKARLNPFRVVVIDNARHYQNLQRKGLISKYTERFVLNWFIRGLYKMILPMKCSNDPDFTKEYAELAIKLYKKYPLFYIYMYPFLLLPKWMLIIPYRIGRRIKFLSSPF